MRAGIDPNKLRCRAQFADGLETWNDAWTGMGPIMLPRWGWFNIRSLANQRSSCVVGTFTWRGEVSTPMMSVFVPGVTKLRSVQMRDSFGIRD